MSRNFKEMSFVFFLNCQNFKIQAHKLSAVQEVLLNYPEEGGGK